jgi:hypothetical protein
MRPKRTAALILFLLLFFLAKGAWAEIPDLAGKIAFLRDGEVWTADKGGGKARQLTRSEGKVADFLFSPTLKYLAYSKVFKFPEEPGLWEKGEKAPRRAVSSIIILRLRDQRVVREIIPKEGEWIYFDKWLPRERLLGHTSSGFDVAGFFEFDAGKNALVEVEYHEGSRLMGADFSSDGSMELYVDDSGIGKEFRMNLHLVNFRSNTDKIILSKRSILSPKLSSDKKQIAFFEVEQKGKEFFDNLWICNTAGESLRKLFRGPAKPLIGGVNQLAFSFDGRHVAMFFPQVALVLQVKNPANWQQIQGSAFSWVANNRIAYSKRNGVFLFHLKDRKAELLLENASKPVFLESRTNT